MVDRLSGEECLMDLNMHEVPFWIQVHGLQIRAINKEVGAMIAPTIGNVTEIKYDTEGEAYGRCIRLKAVLDIHKPLVRWTNISIGGSLCRLFFRYEKLADFCFYCGRLDHVDKDCREENIGGKKHFGPWLKAHYQYPGISGKNRYGHREIQS